MSAWGLLAGLGQGMQQAGALNWERAKEERLQAIRSRERDEDREARREDARLDREARKTDAKELAEWERNQADTLEDILDSSGNIVGQRNPRTGEVKSVSISTENSNDEWMKRVGLYLQKTDPVMLTDPLAVEEYNNLASLYRQRLAERVGGAAGGEGTGAGADKDAALAAALAKEDEEKRRAAAGGAAEDKPSFWETYGVLKEGFNQMDGLKPEAHPPSQWFDDPERRGLLSNFLTQSRRPPF